MKAVVVDGNSVYIGSVNLDRRSADKNTELGMWIESREFAQQMLEALEAIRRLGAYCVQLASARKRFDGSRGMSTGPNPHFPRSLSRRR